MLRRGYEREGRWTLAEGVRDATGILLRRMPLAIALWALFLLGVRAYLGLVSPGGADASSTVEPLGGGRLGRSLSPGLGGAFVMGCGVGWILVRHLVDRVHFTGAVLRSLAVAAAGVSIYAATWLLSFTMPATATVYLIVLGVVGLVMATVLVLFGTWGE